MKRPTLVALLMFTSFSWLCALDDINIISSVLVPARFYVGDPVELRIRFQTPFDRNLEVPESMPVMDWGLIHGIEVEAMDDVYELRVRFTSWAPGTRTLPIIRAGSLSFEQLTVHVPSIIEAQERGFPHIRSNQVVAGTPLLLVLQILLWVGLMASVLFAVWNLVPRLQVLRRRRKAALPLRRAQRSLRELAVQAAQADPVVVYSSLMQEARTYFSDRLRKGALAATTSELESLLQPAISRGELMTQLLDLFRQGDRVKFAGEAISRQQVLDRLHGLVVLLKAIEEDINRAGL